MDVSATLGYFFKLAAPRQKQNILHKKELNYLTDECIHFLLRQ